MTALHASLAQNKHQQAVAIQAIKALIAECRDQGSAYLTHLLSELSEARTTENLLDRIMFKHATRLKDELGQESIIRYRQKIFQHLEEKFTLFFDDACEGYRKKFIEAPKSEAWDNTY